MGSLFWLFLVLHVPFPYIFISYRYSPPEQTIKLLSLFGHTGFNINSSLLHFGTFLEAGIERTIHLRVQEEAMFSTLIFAFLIEPSSLILEPDLDYLVRIIALFLRTTTRLVFRTLLIPTPAYKRTFLIHHEKRIHHLFFSSF